MLLVIMPLLQLLPGSLFGTVPVLVCMKCPKLHPKLPHNVPLLWALHVGEEWSMGAGHVTARRMLH